MVKRIAAIPALFVCAIFLLLVILPVTYFNYDSQLLMPQCGGGIPAQGYCGTRSPFDYFPDSLKGAKATYESNCIYCHGFADAIVGPPLKSVACSQVYLTSLFYGKKGRLQKRNKHYKQLAEQYGNMNFHDQVKFPFGNEEKQRLFRFLRHLNSE